MKKLSIFAMTLVLGFGTACFGQAQLEGLTKDKVPPPANKLYEDNLRLPDDAGKLFLPDDAYLRWPLPAGEEAYASVDGMAMKKRIPEITAISRKSRDDGNQFWGRIAGTVYDRMIQDWMEQQFKAIGLEQVRRQELDMSPLWYPNSWEASSCRRRCSNTAQDDFSDHRYRGHRRQDDRGAGDMAGSGHAGRFQRPRRARQGGTSL